VREEMEVCGLGGFSRGRYVLMREDLLVEGEKEKWCMRGGYCKGGRKWREMKVRGKMRIVVGQLREERLVQVATSLAERDGLVRS